MGKVTEIKERPFSERLEEAHKGTLTYSVNSFKNAFRALYNLINDWLIKCSEYEDQMQKLNAVIGDGIKIDPRINELMEWFNKEYYSRTGLSPERNIVAIEIRKAAYVGLNLNFSLMEAYRILKAKLDFIDNTLTGIEICKCNHPLPEESELDSSIICIKCGHKSK